MRFVLKTHITGCLNGVIIMTTVQHVVSGTMIRGTKSGANCPALAAGNITARGRRI